MIRQRRDPATNARIVHEHRDGEGRVQAFHGGRQVGQLTYHVN